jgi:DNA-binding IclR family transcriptional regulator
MDPTSAPGDGTRLVGSDRVLAVLVELARHPHGVTLDELARAAASPKSTVHRALGALRRAGLARQDGRGHYLLGDEFVRMAFAFHEARPENLQVTPVLDALARHFGETAHYAVLDGRSVVYRAKVDPPSGAVRLTSTVGGRNPAHSTAVGKLLLSFRLRDQDAVRAWIGDGPLPRPTASTLHTAEALHAEFEKIRARGYAVDDQENELGITCVAVPAFLDSPTVPSGAVSVSALAYRTPLHTLLEGLPALRDLAAALHRPDVVADLRDRSRHGLASR